jgi:hypothetical protein
MIMSYPPSNQPPQSGGYQQYLPPGQQPQQAQPYQPYPGQAPQPQAPQQPGYGYPPPQQGYGQPPAQSAAPVDFTAAFGQADLSSGGPPIPGGRYPVVIAEPAEWGQVSTGKEAWIVKVRVDGGEHNGRTFTKRVVVSPDNNKAMGMAYRQGAALAGLPIPVQGQPLPAAEHWQQGGAHMASLMTPGRPLTAEIILKPRNDDPSQMTNDVTFIHPREGQQQAAPPQQYAQPARQAMPYPPSQTPQARYGAAPAGTGSAPTPGPSAAGPPPNQQGYQAPGYQAPQYQAPAQQHPGGTQEFAPQQGTIGQQAAPNGQPPQQAPQQQQGGTLPTPPWQQG